MTGIGKRGHLAGSLLHSSQSCVMVRSGPHTAVRSFTPTAVGWQQYPPYLLICLCTVRHAHHPHNSGENPAQPPHLPLIMPRGRVSFTLFAYYADFGMISEFFLASYRAKAVSTVGICLTIRAFGRIGGL